MEKLCRVTITDIEGGGHVVEVKASSLFEAVAQAIRLKVGSVATDGFRPIKVLVYEPKAEYEVKLKDDGSDEDQGTAGCEENALAFDLKWNPIRGL